MPLIPNKIPPPPNNAPMLDEKGMVTPPWRDWFSTVQKAISSLLP